LTLAAARAYQTEQGFTPANQVGPLTRAKLNASLSGGSVGNLPAGCTSTTTTATGACAGVTFTRNLTTGATGSDVKCLQSILNQSASTRVSATGAGSPGSETTYFGPKTLVAVRTYQAQQGFTPANQVGPLTRARLNSAIGTGTGTGTGTYYPPVTPTGAGLAVQLASDNPAAGTVVAGQGLAPLARFVFVNGDNSAVKVTSLKVNRTGYSEDADLANVYLMQGAVRLTDAASLSSGVVNFNDPNGLFTVPSGSSTEITVASDICAKGTCTTIVGQTLALSITSMSSVTTNASSVRGNFPVSGNLFTVADATLATVAFGLSTSSPSANTSLNPQNDYPIWQSLTTVGTRAVSMTRIAFRLIGSIQQSDLRNFRLNIDGVQVGSAVQQMDTNGYVTFDLASSPATLQAGTRVVKLMADIINGSSRSFYTSIRVAADANFVDSQYGVNIAPTTTSASSFVVASVTTGTQTIASGTLSVTKANDSPSGTVILGASNATVGKYTFTAAGEPVKVTDLYVYISNATSTNLPYFRNGALYANGVQVGSTTSIISASGTAGTHFSLGSSMIVNPGSPVTLEVRADIHEVSTNATGSYNVNSGDSITAVLVNG